MIFTSGVYLSHNGVILVNDSRMFINEIGANTASAVMCTSDSMPCCRFQQHGEWKFPNGGLVQQTTTFVRTRDDNGNVNLFRANNTVISPTGRFCCEVEDATGTNQIQCVIVCKFPIIIYIYRSIL